jgi:hypothetical protein
MEMLIIEKQAFDELTGRIERLQTLLNGLYTESGAAPQKWLDNPRACLRLSASRRTLQSLRDSGMLPFTKMGAKIFYKPEDIENLLLTGYKSIKY